LIKFKPHYTTTQNPPKKIPLEINKQKNEEPPLAAARINQAVSSSKNKSSWAARFR
jgi:hypothetical protein